VNAQAPTTKATDGLVTISLLRLGTDTSAASACKALHAASGQWPTPDGVGHAISESAQRVERARRQARAALADAAALKVDVLTVGDPQYPTRLREIHDPPVVLWTQGTQAILETRSVAIVGSRYPSATGLATARRLSSELVRAGLTVVSGLARGIDGAAHRGALDAGGRTMAVLGNGSDVLYPAEHRDLYAAVRQAGVVVTEFPPGTRPHPRHFPLRNRIISGLSEAVVVVEASQKSGSLITARAALDQGRDVLAVPGDVACGRHRGCHALIKDGARLVETVDDILEELGGPLLAEMPDGKLLQDNGLASGLPRGVAVTVDQLARKTGRPAAEWLQELALLELEGAVARLPGGSFVRLDGPATYIEGQPPEGRKDTGSRHAEGPRRRRIARQGEDD
jgi:DNA processing protein